VGVPLWLTALAAITGALHIRAERAGARRRVYLWKPLTTGLIVVAAAMISPAQSGGYRSLILGGLVFSWAGDVLLMLPADRFVAGMISFLAAHLCYIAAFVTYGGWSTDLLLFMPFALGGGVVTVLIWPRLGRMRLPVLIYVAAILVMGWQAAGYGQLTERAPAVLGAVLFILSDACLALDRFWRPLSLRTFLVLGAYYPAQALIAWSVLR
jgi:uncharacterized membrane protein YhhN